MKKKTMHLLATTGIALLLIVIARMTLTFAWWSFTIPLIGLGMYTSWRDWPVSAFLAGFLAGFVLWITMNVYFDSRGGGIKLERLSELASVPKPMVLLISGIIGGLVSGVACYTGRSAWPAVKDNNNL